MGTEPTVPQRPRPSVCFEIVRAILTAAYWHGEPAPQ